MKIIILFSLYIFIHFNAFSQEIENIFVEKKDNHIYIHYDLVKAIPSGIYNISIYCSINDGPRFEIKNVSGDVGSGEMPFKNKLVIWDYKKELTDNVIDNIQNLEFFILAEKLKKAFLPERINDNKFFIGYNGGFTNILGLKLGMIGKWGGYLTYQGVYSQYVERTYSPFSFSIGAIKWIPKSRFFFYSGVGIGNWADYYLLDYPDEESNRLKLQANLGVLLIVQWLYLDIGTSFTYGDNRFHDTSELTFGFGFIF